MSPLYVQDDIQMHYQNKRNSGERVDEPKLTRDFDGIATILSEMCRVPSGTCTDLCPTLQP